jgi:hypothetical protein
LYCFVTIGWVCLRSGLWFFVNDVQLSRWMWMVRYINRLWWGVLDMYINHISVFFFYIIILNS